MAARTQRTLQALVLASLGLTLLQKLWSGTLVWYLSERFFVLVLAAAFGLLILARSVLPAWRATHESAAIPTPVRGERPLAAWRLWLVALPLILGLLLPSRPLGASALALRGVNNSVPPPTAGSGVPDPQAVPPNARTVLDWVRVFNAADPTTFAGEPADVVGFVYHDPRLDAGEFMVSRFIAGCCAAGASGVGLRVQWPNAAGLESNAWVRVRGAVQAGIYAGRPIPVITAASVEGLEPPLQPYLEP